MNQLRVNFASSISCFADKFVVYGCRIFGRRPCRNDDGWPLYGKWRKFDKEDKKRGKSEEDKKRGKSEEDKKRGKSEEERKPRISSDPRKIITTVK